MNGEIEIKLQGLDQLVKALKKPAPPISVGVLGESPRQPVEGAKQQPTNAQVGAFAEFGTATSPVRSWLRMPLMTRLGPALEESGAFDKATLKEVIATADLRPWMVRIGIMAEAVILDAFDSGGFGQWKKSDMSRKKNHQTLVETQQLRNSISHVVGE